MRSSMTASPKCLPSRVCLLLSAHQITPRVKPGSTEEGWTRRGQIRDKCPLGWDNDGCDERLYPEPKGTCQVKASRNLAAISVTFDEDNLVPNGGLIAPAALAQRLGIAELVQDRVRLDKTPSGRGQQRRQSADRARIDVGRRRQHRRHRRAARRRGRSSSTTSARPRRSGPGCGRSTGATSVSSTRSAANRLNGQARPGWARPICPPVDDRHRLHHPPGLRGEKTGLHVRYTKVCGCHHAPGPCGCWTRPATSGCCARDPAPAAGVARLGTGCSKVTGLPPPRARCAEVHAGAGRSGISSRSRGGQVRVTVTGFAAWVARARRSKGSLVRTTAPPGRSALATTIASVAEIP